MLSSIVAVFAVGACGADDTPVADQPRELSPGEPQGGSGGGPSGPGGAGTEVGSAGADGSPEAGEGGAASGGASGETHSSGGSAASSSTEPPPPSEALPDLVLDAAYLIDTTAIDTVSIDDMCLVREGCVTGLGERKVVRFGSRTGNVGTADFELGRAEAGNSLWTFDECQESFDLVGFARYVLRDSATGEVLVVGAKSGFCIADAEEWIEGSGSSCDVYDCRQQGISRGCADNYGSALECQWVDVTDIPSGTYELTVTINADRNIAELDYANNVVRLSIELSGDAVSVLR